MYMIYTILHISISGLCSVALDSILISMNINVAVQNFIRLSLLSGELAKAFDTCDSSSYSNTKRLSVYTLFTIQFGKIYRIKVFATVQLYFWVQCWLQGGLWLPKKFPQYRNILY